MFSLGPLENIVNQNIDITNKNKITRSVYFLV